MGLYFSEARAPGMGGRSYNVGGYTLKERIPADAFGVILFVRHDKEADQCYVVYVSSGNAAEETKKEIERGAVIEKGATRVFIHYENDTSAVREIEEDIKHGSPECFEPIGCNKPG
jgi:hypothetical protein